jgi:iron-sulfur cluster assembly protein
LNVKKEKMNLRIPPRVTDRAFRKIAISCESKILRVAVKGGGCSGFQYIFDIVDSINEDDQVFEKEECRVIIDETSLQFLEGAEIDYSEELIGSSFKINNPNATSSCGCGTSFSFSPSFE